MRFFLLLFLIFFLYRLGNFIPVPFIINDGTVYDFLSTLTKTGVLNQSALKRLSVFSLGIVPYITSGILIQLVKFLFAESSYGVSLKNKVYLSKQTIIFTLFIAIFQGYMFSVFAYKSTNNLVETFSLITILVSGTFVMIWFAKLITSFGFGNGASILIMFSIIEQFFISMFDIISSISNGQISIIEFFGHIIYVVFFLILISLVELSARLLKLSYPSTKFRDGYHKGKKSDFLPFKINNSGVLPLIFAMSFSGFLATSLVPFVFNKFGYDISIILTFFTLGFIVFFIFFYTPFVVNTQDISNNLKKSNIILDNRRPGIVTKEYMDLVLIKLNYIAICYLGFMVIIPDFMQLQGINVIVSGVSIVILVVVVIDIVKRIQYMNYSNKFKKMAN